MPVSIDLLTKHKKSSLRENSIKFDKKPKTGRYEVKKKVVLSPDMTLEKLEEERRKREAEIAFVSAQFSRDIVKNFGRLGHAKNLAAAYVSMS